ncbi:MAG: extracellular solute-binding protein [Selenomonadaceae bacterium]|nr:extracellular solute-binding protein [Selenomonadaceae bacterium]
MRRYTTLFVMAFVLTIAALAGSSFLAGAGHKENGKPLAELTVYTTLPANMAAVLADEYEQATKVRVNFIPLGKNDLLKRLASPPEAQKIDLTVADEEVLRQGAAVGAFQPYISEPGDAVADTFKDANGYWTGIWYDPVVFCLNRDYLKSLTYIPHTWTELTTVPGVRIAVTDFMAADAAANLLYSMIAQYGDTAAYDIWRQIHPHVVQYTKFLANPVRQTGMGEADVSLAVQSEALRGLNSGYPLKIIYPTDGTAYMLTGTAIMQGLSPEKLAIAQNFADWLLSDDAQLTLQRHEFYFLTVNPATLAYKTFAGKNIVLYSERAYFTPEERRELIDRWVKYIRFQ